MDKEIKAGDIVKHKVMKGKFVVIENTGDFTISRYIIIARGEDGKIYEFCLAELTT